MTSFVRRIRSLFLAGSIAVAGIGALTVVTDHKGLISSLAFAEQPQCLPPDCYWV
jgi:hypothetical protein